MYFTIKLSPAEYSTLWIKKGLLAILRHWEPLLMVASDVCCIFSLSKHGCSWQKHSLRDSDPLLRYAQEEEPKAELSHCTQCHSVCGHRREQSIFILYGTYTHFLDWIKSGCYQLAHIPTVKYWCSTWVLLFPSLHRAYCYLQLFKIPRIFFNFYLVTQLIILSWRLSIS